MAPIAPLGRDAAIRLVVAGPLPITFGSPHPTVMVLEQEGRLRIRQLVVDPHAVRATDARRPRSPSWMPEHYYALGQPTGEIYADAGSLDELVATMRTMPWPAHW